MHIVLTGPLSSNGTRVCRFIRQEHGDYFGISVAGYPEGHIDWFKDTPEINKEDYWRDLQVFALHVLICELRFAFESFSPFETVNSAQTVYQC